MKAELVNIIADIRNSLDLLEKRMNLDIAKKRLEELNAMSEEENFWADPFKAKQLMRERQFLSDNIDGYNALCNELNENLELRVLAESENDLAILSETENAFYKIKQSVELKETEILLDGEVDANDTFLEINAGAGGTESCDWASMLTRMYTRWAEKQNYEIELISEHLGDEAGIKSITLKVKGLNAYGWLKTESGVHRLVRISPFDSNARRHTSFSSVWVYPVIDDNIDINIPSSELRIDTYRSSGAGGQHVNTTDSAVRITHIPTKIVVQCQNDRSQHKNKANALSMLKSRLYELEIQKRKENENQANSIKKEIGWGNQIRSYVLHPYKMIKDSRTNYETSNALEVLNGNIDRFLELSLTK